MQQLKELHKICVMGDSILKSVIFNEEAGRYTFMKEGAVYAFEQAHDVEVVNYAKFGCTIPKGYEKLRQVLEKGDSSEAVLIEFGGNDCDYDWDAVAAAPLAPHTPNTPYGQFTETLDRMIALVQDFGKRPFVMNLPPISHERYFQWISKGDAKRAENLLTFLKNENIIYRHQEYYSRALELAAMRHGLYIVNVRDAFLPIQDYDSYLCADGIHPNEKGQRMIQDVFARSYAELFS